MMIIVKGLVVAGIVASGLIALLGGSDPASGAATIGYYPDATLPALFQPMRH